MKMSNERLNNENFQSILAKGIHLVELAGDQCSGCAALNPVVHNLLKKYPRVAHHYVTVTHNTQAICQEYKIDRIPALVFIFNGQVLSVAKGFQPEEILDIWLESEIAKCQE